MWDHVHLTTHPVKKSKQNSSHVNLLTSLCHPQGDSSEALEGPQGPGQECCTHAVTSLSRAVSAVCCY